MFNLSQVGPILFWIHFRCLKLSVLANAIFKQNLAAAKYQKHANGLQWPQIIVSLKNSI